MASLGRLDYRQPATLVLLLFAAAAWHVRRSRAVWEVPTTHQRLRPVNNRPVFELIAAVSAINSLGCVFCKRLVEFDTRRRFHIVTFCEEQRAAYDRVGLTSFFAHRDAEKLMLARQEWYADNGVELHLGDRASAIDRQKSVVHSDRGVAIEYDHVVLATGSYPFVPPVPGIQLPGVFVYRTLDDLQRIIGYASESKRCVVIGGGLLGLEAAKAAYDFGLETHVVEFATRLMPRQVDDCGSQMLVKQIEALGVRVGWANR